MVRWCGGSAREVVGGAEVNVVNLGLWVARSWSQKRGHGSSPRQYIDQLVVVYLGIA